MNKMEAAKLCSGSLAIWIVLVLLQGSPATGTNSQCRNIVRYIVHSRGIQVKQSRPKISGEWTSSRCEVRPGPKFLARHITIRPNATFSAEFHHYQDSSCSSPSFTIHVEGFYTVLAIKKDNDVLEGATPARFNFTTIQLYPHTKAMQSTIEGTSARSCPGTVHALNATFNGRTIFNVDHMALSKRSCRDKFGVSEFEFSILKLEKRKGTSQKHDLLYFGEIQTSRKTRRRYKPSSYQMPLKKASVPHCSRCTLVKRSSPTKPPIFSGNVPSSTTLKGEWGSTSCETQPGLRFLTRFMKFDSRKLSWERQTTFFMDPFCQQAEFTLNEEGSYHKSASQTFSGSTPYVFTVTAARMTPHDNYIKDILNTVRDNQCGTDNAWKVGVEHDITSSKGCNIYSISIPDTTYELVKYDFNSHGDKELYLGQKRTDEMKFSSPSLRPTSFQVPLVECSAFPSSFVPPTTAPTSEAPTVFPFSEFQPPYTIPTEKRPKSMGSRSRKTSAPTARTQNTRALTAKPDMLARYNAGPSGPRIAERLFLLVISVLWYLS